MSSLTPRELQVVGGIVAGWSSKKIARELGVVFKTIDKHRSNIMVKLGAHKSADVIRWWYENGRPAQHCAGCTCGKTQPASQPEATPVAY